MAIEMSSAIDATLSKHLQLIADPARFAMLMLLMDDGARPAGELANAAGVSMSTASSHLHKLVGAGFLRVHAQGRHRYFRLARADVARAVEALAGLTAPKLRGREQAPASFRRARTCYDHLAGELGVQITQSWVAQGWLLLKEDCYHVPPAGRRELASLGIAIEALGARGRRLARPCIDSTERRPHLAGKLGGALARKLFELRWLGRSTAPREVRITVKGREELARRFGIALTT